MDLFNFRYHLDPIATGSVIESDVVSTCCDQARGHIYTLPVYSGEELDDRICPWCIINGAAHARYGASFVDASGVGGYGEWEGVDEAVTEMIAYRTPGFRGWQQEQWWTHCSDGALFLGPVGWKELLERGEEAVAIFREEAEEVVEGPDVEIFLKSMDKDRGPTGYLFQCRHCKKLGGYWDIH